MSPAGVLWEQEEGLQQKVTWTSVNTTDTKLKDPTEVGSDMLSIKETFLSGVKCQEALTLFKRLRGYFLKD